MKVYELLISFVIVAVAVAICAGLRSGPEVRAEATTEATSYARGMGYVDPHVQCVEMDSDGDGYVSCTVAFTQPNGTIGKDAIECVGGISVVGALNSGCRTPKMRAVSQ